MLLMLKNPSYYHGSHHTTLKDRGAPKAPSSLLQFLERFAAALRTGVRPGGHGYAYLGLDVVRAADGPLYLLEAGRPPRLYK